MIAYTSYIYDGRVKRHAEALAQRGDHVDLISLANTPAQVHNGVNLIGVAMPRYRGSSRTAYLRSYVRFFAGAMVIASRLHRAHRYNAVIVCSMPDAVVLCALPLKMFGTPLMLDIHDTMPELYSEKFGGRKGAVGARLLMLEERASARLADRVLAVHDLHRSRLEAAGIPSHKIRVVLNSPDPRIFSQLARSLPTQPDGRTGEDRFTIVCHGTITRRLGLDVAFEAMDLLRERLPGARLEILGTGDYLAAAKTRVDAMKLQQRVSFLPPVLIEALPAALKHADVGLVPNLPSAATHLMLPVKMLEFATLGIPIIAARRRAIEHYFGASAARFFEAGNSADLAAAIVDLSTNARRRAQLACRASEIAEALSWPRQLQLYFDAVDSLLSGGVAERRKI
jgi:glycosyltransferase involved in cell wall biosynthesis